MPALKPRIIIYSAMATDATLEKPLPYSEDAERSILGAVLLDEQLFNHVAELLTCDDFYLDKHRRIFSAMEALSAQSRAIDIITVKEELERTGELEAAGGAAYLASLTDGLPRATNIEHYGRIVKEKSILRRMIAFADETLRRCMAAEEDVLDILESTEKRIFEIAEEKVRSGFLPIKEVIKGTFKDLEELYERKQLITGVPTGFTDFDELTSGLQPSDLIIVAARPGLGKTSFCLNIAETAAIKHNLAVGIFSLEMSASQLIRRMLCSQARVNSHKFRSGFLSREEWAKIAVAMGVLSEARIFIDDTAGISIVEIRSKARRLKAERGLDLLIIDYLQLISGRGKYENRTQEISAISRALKGLAKELNIPVVAISQLSRAPEVRRGDHRPQLSDLRESGSLEQDADMVAFIFREELYNPTEDNAGVAEVIVAKQRSGPTGTIKLAFIKEYTRFENLYKED